MEQQRKHTIGNVFCPEAGAETLLCFNCLLFSGLSVFAVTVACAQSCFMGAFVKALLQAGMIWGQWTIADWLLALLYWFPPSFLSLMSQDERHRPSAVCYCDSCILHTRLREHCYNLQMLQPSKNKTYSFRVSALTRITYGINYLFNFPNEIPNTNPFWVQPSLSGQ